MAKKQVALLFNSAILCYHKVKVDQFSMFRSRRILRNKGYWTVISMVWAAVLPFGCPPQLRCFSTNILYALLQLVNILYSDLACDTSSCKKQNNLILLATMFFHNWCAPT